MIMNETTNNKLREILDLLSEHFLYVKLGGSYSLSFINNPHDYDIIVICDTFKDRMYCKKYLLDNYNVRDLRKDYKLDFHFITKEYEDEFLVTSIYPFYYKQSDIIYQTLKDYKIIKKDISAILDNANNIYKSLKIKLDNILSLSDNVKYQHKFWYYAYTTLCVLKNNSYELTTEQIENINILHDRKDETWSLRVNLIDDIINEIELRQI